MSRFFVKQEAIDGAVIQIENAEDCKHIVNVLRLKPGDQIDVSDSAAFEYTTEIVEIEKERITLKILDKQRFGREPNLRVTLFQGVPKSGKMEEIIQRSTELGLSELYPLFTKRCIIDTKKNVDKKLERWQKVAAEAVKQCRRGLVPVVGETIDVTEAIKRFGEFDLVLFPFEDEQKTTIKSVLRAQTTIPRSVAIFIGPEGGFAKDEAEAIMAAGGRSVSLGKPILRTETAGPAALAMVLYEWEME